MASTAGASGQQGRCARHGMRLNLRGDFENRRLRASEETSAALPPQAIIRVDFQELDSPSVQAMVDTPSEHSPATESASQTDISLSFATGTRESSVDKNPPSEHSTTVEATAEASSRPPRWADMNDEDVADNESSAEAEPAGDAEPAPCSEGSVGHPVHCAAPCKYYWRPRGCKDGFSCKRCHLCPFRRALLKRKA